MLRKAARKNNHSPVFPPKAGCIYPLRNYHITSNYLKLRLVESSNRNSFGDFILNAVFVCFPDPGSSQPQQPAAATFPFIFFPMSPWGECKKHCPHSPWLHGVLVSTVGTHGKHELPLAVPEPCFPSGIVCCCFYFL